MSPTPRALPAHPFARDPDLDADRPKEECGLFGVHGLADAASFVALGLHALQHRGQEAAGVVTWDEDAGFCEIKRMGYVRDNFTKPDVMARLPGRVGMGHVRYSTAGAKGETAGLVKLSRT